ncbi:MAG: hypothetical protein CW691_05120 [Candidatus Bathyarchaeum sp.]|nr:MAG: hypothetical protein CW691_05120 [Candidatus Bathyarchaeum sp.]
MNKYALTVPLTILSVLLGYFASSLQIEHIIGIATISTVLVAAYGYFLFLQHQKGEEKLKRHF